MFLPIVVEDTNEVAWINGLQIVMMMPLGKDEHGRPVTQISMSNGRASPIIGTVDTFVAMFQLGDEASIKKYQREYVAPAQEQGPRKVVHPPRIVT